MNRDDDLIGQLEDYLADVGGVSSLPDRVRDAIRAELPRTRQVRRVRGPGRMFDMVSQASTRARWGLAAAAVVAAVFLGAAVLTNGGNAGPGIGSAPATASPSPSPSPSPTPTPSPTPSGPASLSSAPYGPCEPGGGAPDCIAPGTYSLTSSAWPGKITLDLPAGWFQYKPAADFEGVLVDGGPDALGGSGWGVMVIAVGPVAVDPCDQSLGTLDPTRTSTVDGFVTAVSSWPGFEATAPTPIVVDGFSGQLIELTTSRTSKDCPLQRLWTTPEGWWVDGYPIVNATATPHADQLRIVDVDGTLVVIRTTDFPETSPYEEEQGVAPDPTRHAADQVELHEIVDSIRITVEP
jgi:hypothetical protein